MKLEYPLKVYTDDDFRENLLKSFDIESKKIKSAQEIINEIKDEKIFK